MFISPMIIKKDGQGVCQSANLLFLCVEKFFKMKKSECKEALEIYKRFLTRVTKIGEFMKLAEVASAVLFLLTHIVTVKTESVRCDNIVL